MSFHNSYTYLKKVDELPTGPEWHCEVITAEGDVLDENGQRLMEDCELWFRDPVKCVSELLANPAFIDFISYAPERVYSDNEGRERIFDEIWTANWWWEMQVSTTSAVVKIQHMKLFFFVGRATYLTVLQLHPSSYLPTRRTSRFFRAINPRGRFI